MKGKVVRSGYVRPDYFNINGYSQNYLAQEEPIIEVAGQLRFELPGTPDFSRPDGRNDPQAAPGMADRD